MPGRWDCSRSAGWQSCAGSPAAVITPLPAKPPLSTTNSPPVRLVLVAAPLNSAPLTAQVPPSTCRLLKLVYTDEKIAPLPAALESNPLRRVSVLLPLAPPSTMPTGANARLTPRLLPRTPLEPLPETLLPVTAMNWLVLPAPSDTLPYIVPLLVKTLPWPDVSNATRPWMVARLFRWTRPPP